MKRLLAISLCGILMLASLTGCGEGGSSTGGSVTTEVSVSVSSETKTSASASESSASESAVTGETSPYDQEYVKLIQSFLNGSVKATASGVDGVKDGTYTFDELTKCRGLELLGGYSHGFTVDNVEYLISDFGSDLKPELLMKVNYTELDSMSMPLVEYLVVKSFDGASLNVTVELESYYRSEIYINEYGYVEDGGSDSAFSSVNTLGYIDKDGQYVKLAICDAFYGLSDVLMPPELLPVSMQDDQKIVAYSDGGFGDVSVEAWLVGDLSALNSPEGENADWDAYWDNLAKARKYCFFKETENVMPASDALQAMTDLGLTVIDQAARDKSVDEVFDKVGLSYDKRRFDTAEWKVLSDDPKLTMVKEAKKAFNDYVNGDGKAFYVNTDGYEALTDGEYTYATFANMVTGHLTELSDAYDWDSADYAYIDAGMDGIPELVCRFRYSDWNDYYSPIDCYAVLTYKDGKLNVSYFNICDYYGFYRITKEGVIDNFGYDGAMATYEHFSILNADCEECFLYSVSEYSGLGEDKIPDDMLPTALYERTHPDSEYKWGGAYSYKAYSFEPFPEYSDDISFEEHYGRVATARLYALFKEGANTSPDGDYEQLCRDNGLEIVSMDYIDAKIKERLSEYGLDSETFEITDLTWYPLSMG